MLLNMCSNFVWVFIYFLEPRELHIGWPNQNIFPYSPLAVSASSLWFKFLLADSLKECTDLKQTIDIYTSILFAVITIFFAGDSEQYRVRVCRSHLLQFELKPNRCEIATALSASQHAAGEDFVCKLLTYLRIVPRRWKLTDGEKSATRRWIDDEI